MTTCLLGHPPHRLCAVCHSTHRTHKLCDECKADPANADWNGDDDAAPSESVDAMIPACRLADLQTIRRIKGASDLEIRILRLVHHGRVRVEIHASKRRCNHQGSGNHAHRYRHRAMRFTEVAREVGCSESYVRKVLQKTLNR